VGFYAIPLTMDCSQNSTVGKMRHPDLNFKKRSVMAKGLRSV